MKKALFVFAFLLSGCAYRDVWVIENPRIYYQNDTAYAEISLPIYQAQFFMESLQHNGATCNYSCTECFTENAYIYRVITKQGVKIIITQR